MVASGAAASIVFDAGHHQWQSFIIFLMRENYSRLR